MSIAADVHVTLDTEFISHTRTALFGTIASLEDSDGGVIPDSEMHDLLTRIHDILDNAIAKEVGNTSFIISFLFCFQAVL